MGVDDHLSRNTRRPSAVGSTLLLPVMLLVSCGPESGTEPSALDGSTGQSEVDINFAAYEQAFLAFQDCMSTGGQPIEDVLLDQTLQLYSFFIPSEATDSGLEDTCYRAFEPLDRGWQLSPARPKPRYQTMLVPEAIAICLEVDAGVTMPADLSGPEAVDFASANGYSLDECLMIARENASEIVTGD